MEFTFCALPELAPILVMLIEEVFVANTVLAGVFAARSLKMENLNSGFSVAA